MLENGKEYWIVNPKVKASMRAQGIWDIEMYIQRTNTDHWISRTAIRRGTSGNHYWVARYNGHYHQIMGGIRTPFFLSEIKQGKY
jgi:hypothetical protein